MFRFLLICFLFPLVTSAQIEDSLIRPLKAGRIVHSHKHLYKLPYEGGKRYLLVQGWQSNLSHKGMVAQDFRMRKGRSVCAARSGRVIEIKDDGEKGGYRKKFLGEGNHVIVEHDDSTYAVYWHLSKGKVFVKTGQKVVEGQALGLSGNTGYSAFPHLHFAVYKRDRFGRRRSIPVRFKTTKGARYLRPGRFYKSV